MEAGPGPAAAGRLCPARDQLERDPMGSFIGGGLPRGSLRQWGIWCRFVAHAMHLLRRGTFVVFDVRPAKISRGCCYQGNLCAFVAGERIARGDLGPDPCTKRNYRSLCR